MSEVKHTPGPWELSMFSKPDGSPIVTTEDVAETVAASARWPGGVAELWGITIPGTTDVIAYTGNGPTREANARLIAACPDLLAACKLWDQGFTDGEEFTEAQLLAWMNANRRAARAAVAKAEGAA
jgi:hypothetical protein